MRIEPGEARRGRPTREAPRVQHDYRRAALREPMTPTTSPTAPSPPMTITTVTRSLSVTRATDRETSALRHSGPVQLRRRPTHDTHSHRGATTMEPILPAYKAVGERALIARLPALYLRGFRTRRRVRASPRPHRARRRQYLFTLLTLNMQQVHFDAAYAAKTEWKKLLVDFDLHARPGHRHERAHRQRQGRRQPRLGQGAAPRLQCSPATRSTRESTVLHKRESNSRPTQGIVTVATRGINQDGVEVMSFERTMLVHRRGHSPEDAANY